VIAPIGAAVPNAEIGKALNSKKYKIVAVTHVDTSTGVLSDVKAVAEIVQRIAPGTLVGPKVTLCIMQFLIVLSN
jgi:alanine-glyoxylate transaminase / serine-glyoxylate transaminase / serine-pyruvate transaminase